MRPLLIFLALGGCANAVPPPAADPARAGLPLAYGPLAPAIGETPPLDWRAANDALRPGDGEPAGHKH